MVRWFNSRSKFTKGVEADAKAVKNSHVDEAGADKGLMPAIRDNEERFEGREEELTGPAKGESWFSGVEVYDVDTDLDSTGYNISEIDLKVGIPGVETTEIESDSLSDYIDEVERKFTAVRDRKEHARSIKSIIQSGEDFEEEKEAEFVAALLGESTEDYEGEFEDLLNSNVAERNSELEEVRDLIGNGVSALDDRIDNLGKFESAYHDHARETADQYHADAKRNIKCIAEGAEDALETFAETVNAASIVAGYAEETVNHDNYDSVLANEDAALQRPVMEAAQDAVEEAGETVAAYMSELQEGVDDLEEAADKFGEFLDTEEVENMSETVREYRQGMVDLTENIVGNYADLEDVEVNSVDGYVMELMNQSGLTDQVDLPEDQNLRLQPYGGEA